MFDFFKKLFSYQIDEVHEEGGQSMEGVAATAITENPAGAGDVNHVESKPQPEAVDKSDASRSRMQRPPQKI